MWNLEDEITSKNQLINYILDGCKAKKDFKIGIEFESFLYNKPDFSPVDYKVIANIMHGFNSSIWQDILEDGKIIGLQSAIGSISLEPAGQFEYSSEPAENINILNKWLNEYFTELLNILERNHTGIYNLGYNAKHDVLDLPLMPKERYNFMYNYMPKVGSLGRNMMKGTCTLQANLDFSSEADLAKKFKVSMALQPLISAIYANSPIVQGKATPYKTYRMKVWENTDDSRSGIIPFVFEGDFSIEKYVDYALRVPMYFVNRDGKYITQTNKIIFSDYLSGKYRFPKITPILDDFVLHLSTLFPDVRLKQYIETRSADCPDKPFLLSLGALFVGLLYSNTALDETFNYIKGWSFVNLQQLKKDILQEGLNASINNVSLKNVALDILEISKKGLQSRGLGEEQYIENLQQIVQTGKTLAEYKLHILQQCHGDIDKFIESISITR